MVGVQFAIAICTKWASGSAVREWFRNKEKQNFSVEISKRTMHSLESCTFIGYKINISTLHFISPCEINHSINYNYYGRFRGSIVIPQLFGLFYHILISNFDNLLRCLSNSDLNERLMSRFLIMYGIKIAKQMRHTPIKLITIPGSASSW